MINNNIISENKIKEYSPLALAFIGDSIHTLFIRDYILKTKNLSSKNFHLLASKYCKAKSQKEVFEKIFPEFTEKEKEIAIRARNQTSHTAKNASPEEYKKATAFEAVLGYLYLTGNKTRLDYILQKSLKDN